MNYYPTKTLLNLIEKNQSITEDAIDDFKTMMYILVTFNIGATILFIIMWRMV